MLDSTHIDTSRLLGSSQITDCYLLALAHTHGGQLATFDNRLVVDAVRARGFAIDCVNTRPVNPENL